jgi:hypothetical protein
MAISKIACFLIHACIFAIIIKKKIEVIDLVAARALTFYNGITALFEGVKRIVSV